MKTNINLAHPAKVEIIFFGIEGKHASELDVRININKETIIVYFSEKNGRAITVQPIQVVC